jgi:hypothetical protein
VPRREAASARLVALRLSVLTIAAVLLAHVRLSGRPSSLCLLRATTGVPCPLCGGTTAAVHVGRGDLSGALRASPLAVLGAPVVAALPLLKPLLKPRLDRVHRRAGAALLIAALVVAEVWQLARFSLL